jgi:hypothetical protein
VHLLPFLDSSHQSGKIPINTGITCTQFILTLHDLTYMGTASGYIVTQDLYIAWGLARGTLENSLWFFLARCESFFCFSLVILLWFSLASIEPSDSDHKVALTFSSDVIQAAIIVSFISSVIQFTKDFQSVA